jgi:hypothetical protein
VEEFYNSNELGDTGLGAEIPPPAVSKKLKLPSEHIYGDSMELFCIQQFISNFFYIF